MKEMWRESHVHREREARRVHQSGQLRFVAGVAKVALSVEEERQYVQSGQVLLARGISSNGRALALHARGNGIDARILHFFLTGSSISTLVFCRASEYILVASVP